MISIHDIKMLFNDFYSQGKLGKDYAIVFVFNDMEHTDALHITESITAIEHESIMRSFKMIADYTYSYSSEHEFIHAISHLKNDHRYVLVYSMAQNINGVGRRALIPLLCRYYNLINLSSDEYASFLSGNKRLMQTLLEPVSILQFPKTIYLNQKSIHLFKNNIKSIRQGKYMLKPIDESASIGLKKFELCNGNENQLYRELLDYSKQFNSFCIQEFIEGDEIEVPVIKIGEDYFCPGVCQIIFGNNEDFLDYDTIGMDSYEFAPYYDANDRFINSAICVAHQLHFNCIGRIDFRVKNRVPYIIDIGANPTISPHSTTNFLFKRIFDDEASVYHLLVIRALMNSGLFKPSFNHAK